MPLRRGPLRGEGRVRLRIELPLFELPARDGLGIQVIRRDRA